MIYDAFERAAAFHGHKCPGLAIGVRAAAEALQLLGIEESGHSLYCIAESGACYLDGIQVVFSTSWGNGGLELRERGKCAFIFYDRTTGKSVRLLGKDWPQGLEKAEMIDFLLTVPSEQVFDRTAVHFDAPPDSFKRTRAHKCTRCGEECREPFLRVVDGEILCLDCAEKNT